DLQASVDALTTAAATATDDKLMVGILRTVALVSRHGCDAHTGVFVWGTGRYPVDSLPLRLWFFGDDLYVVDPLDPYRSLIGRRVVGLAGHPIVEVVSSVAGLVPRDSSQTVRLILPRYLLIPQVLRGLDLATPGSIDVQTVSADGAQPTSTTVTPIATAAYNAWAGPYGLPLPPAP